MLHILQFHLQRVSGVTAAKGPFCFEAMQVFSAGAVAVDTFNAGAVVVQRFAAGAEAVQVDCAD